MRAGGLMRWVGGAVAVFALVCSMAANQEKPAETGGAGGKLRIGTYDARAIAVAYSASELHNKQLAARKAELKKAEAAGDKKHVDELKAWGSAHQRRMHRQGFAGAQVDDILAQVKGQLPKVAADNGVALIVQKTDYMEANVEVVDVTDALVKLFNPSEKTLKTVKELRKHPPISIEEADNIKD